jgi:triacylglycerol lipase
MSTGEDSSRASDEPDDRRDWLASLLGEMRWQAETARLLIDPVWLGAGVPHGHGEPLMVVPGLLSGDSSLLLLRQWLRRIGYTPEWARMPFNTDCSDRALRALERRVQRIVQRNGAPISLIGHSRGGILGNALATRRPDLLRRVISLGSGHRDGFDVTPALRPMIVTLRTYHRLTTDRVSRHGCMTQACSCSFGVASRAPFPDSVELVSIFSKSDGFANWRSSQVPYARNVEITGSHLGLVANRKAYRAIALALAGSPEETAG